MQYLIAGIAGIAGAVLVAGACSSKPEPAPRLPLDEPLAAGQARAGVVEREAELIGGETARGRTGDLKLYNSKIAVIVGQVGSAKTHHPYGGTILDADRVRPPGEPGRSRFGEVLVGLFQYVLAAEQVEVENDGRNGGAAVVRVRGSPGVIPVIDVFLAALAIDEKPDVEVEVRYVLEPDADQVRLEYSVKNRTRLPIDVGLPTAGFVFGDGVHPFMPGYGFRSPGPGASAEYYAAAGQDVTYLYGRPGVPIQLLYSSSGMLLTALGEPFSLRGLEQKGFVHHLIVGPGDLAWTQSVWRRLAGQEPTVAVSGTVRDTAGAPIEGARVHVSDVDPVAPDRDVLTMTRSDAAGRFTLDLPPGRTVRFQVVADGHHPIDPREVAIGGNGAPESLDFVLEAPGSVRFRVTGTDGALLPAKIMMVPSGRTVSALPGRFLEPARPSGVEHMEFAIRGEGRFRLPRGEYRAVVSRGAEYEIVESTVLVPAGGEVELSATLERSVDTRGWLSTDTHIHAQLSPDSTDSYTLKVASMAVENIELPISTDHDAVGDFNPAIRALGLERYIKGVVGTEVTTEAYGHFNAWPLVADRTRPGNGRIDWYHKTPSEIFASMRSRGERGDLFVQINHPRSNTVGYFTRLGLDPVTLEARVGTYSDDFDGIEVMNGCSIETAERVMADWFGYLSHGERKVATGSTDGHTAMRGEMGLPLTYVRMPSDDPADARIDDFVAAMKAGRMMVTCGPFLELSAAGGAEIGDRVAPSGGRVELLAKVTAPRWMDVDRLEVVLNGTVARTISLPEGAGSVERFSGTITATVPAGRDGWLILRARGDRPHGIHAQGVLPFAFTNPLFVDGDGDGAWKM